MAAAVDGTVIVGGGVLAGVGSGEGIGGVSAGVVSGGFAAVAGADVFGCSVVLLWAFASHGGTFDAGAAAVEVGVGVCVGGDGSADFGACVSQLGAEPVAGAVVGESEGFGDELGDEVGFCAGVVDELFSQAGVPVPVVDGAVF